MAQAFGTESPHWSIRAVFLHRNPRFMTRYRGDPIKFAGVKAHGSRSSRQLNRLGSLTSSRQLNRLGSLTSSRQLNIQ